MEGVTTTKVDKPLFGKYKRLTHAEIILVLVSIILVWLSFLTSDIQYNRNIAFINQQNIANQTASLSLQTASLHEIINKQGNLSNAQRQLLLQQFVNITKHGGFATNEDIAENKAILKDLNDSFAAVNQSISSNNHAFSQINLKLDKLLNQTRH